MNKRGSSLIEVIVAGTILAVLAIGYTQNISSFNRSNAALVNKVVAENAVASLLELYRSMTPEEMTGYLTRLKEIPPPCEPIPGDYNHDGSVDTSDWTPDPNNTDPVHLEKESVWRANVGRSSSCGRPTCWGLPGDFNADGRVDSQDHQVWSQEAAIIPSPTHSPADANLDQRVDSDDLAVWDANNGKVSYCGAPNVPVSPPNARAYHLCEPINPDLSQQPQRPSLVFFDPAVSIRSTGIQNPHRSLTIQIVNMRTMEINRTKCGQPVTTATPGVDEVYMLVSEVAWGEPRVNKLAVSTIIPVRTIASVPNVPPVTPVTPTTCRNYNAAPPPMTGGTWHTYTDNFFSDPQLRPGDWQFNRHHLWPNNAGAEQNFTCKWIDLNEFRLVNPNGGGGTNETGFECQMVLMNPDVLTGPEWNASYEFSIAPSDDCADELVFLWNTDNWTTRDHFYEPIYYGFEADVMENGWDPNGRHFSVIRGVGTPILNVTNGIPNLCDNRWHSIQLSYRHNTAPNGAYLADQSGRLTARFDGREILNTNLQCVDYQYRHFGFHGRSGADTARMKIRNVIINSFY